MKTHKEFIRYSLSGLSMRVGGVIAAFAAAMLLAGCPSSSPSSSIPTVVEANIGTTQDIKQYNDGTKDWTLYSMANRFAAMPVGMTKGTVTEITVPGYIQHITVVNNYGGKNYALLSMGGKGIGVVDITTPAAMSYVRTMTVDYLKPAYDYSDGGGTVFTSAATDPAAPLTNGPVNDLLVYNDGTDDQLLIANTAFGIQNRRRSGVDAEICRRKPLGRPAQPEDAQRRTVRSTGLPGHRHLQSGGPDAHCRL